MFHITNFYQDSQAGVVFACSLTGRIKAKLMHGMLHNGSSYNIYSYFKNKSKLFVC